MGFIFKISCLTVLMKKLKDNESFDVFLPPLLFLGQKQMYIFIHL